MGFIAALFVFLSAGRGFFGCFGNQEIVLAAVRVHGHAMEYASEDFGRVLSLSLFAVSLRSTSNLSHFLRGSCNVLLFRVWGFGPIERKSQAKRKTYRSSFEGSST